MVAVGDTIHYSKRWKFFSDFLSDYIKNILGSEWGNAEIAKPLEERHPIMQWYDKYCHFQRRHKKQADGTYVATATAIVNCYLGLAYNLYLLKHNVALQQRLVARLKNRAQFQGAYYELIVANCLIRAGFALELEDESDESVKHCEFSAVSRNTRRKYWVEAKMRGVSGLLGRTDEDGGQATAKPTSRLSEHLRDALRKPAADERLIFIDVNAPPLERTSSDAEQFKMPKWMERAARQLDDRERDLKETDRAYVFVTNVPFHRVLDDEILGHSILAHGLGIPDFAKPGRYRLPEIWRRKQKHIDAHNIVESFRSYPKIPMTFDGSLPLSKHSMENRIEIGGTYFFEDDDGKGFLGEVTEASVAEGERKAYFVVRTEEGKNQIRTRDMNDEELAHYRAHRDTYFGVIKQTVKRADDPYSLFEWFVDCYKDATKERLLELCKEHPDVEVLRQLDHQGLLLEICERYTIATVARPGSNESERDISPDLRIP